MSSLKKFKLESISSSTDLILKMLKPDFMINPRLVSFDGHFFLVFDLIKKSYYGLTYHPRVVELTLIDTADTDISVYHCSFSYRSLPLDYTVIARGFEILGIIRD